MPTGEVSVPTNPAVRRKKSFTTNELIIGILLPIFAAILAIVGVQEMFPLYLNLGLYTACLIAVGVAVWRWERVAEWGIGKRVAVMIAIVLICAVFIVIPVRKQYHNEYEMDLTFKDNPSVTWWTRVRITRNLVKARDYLKSLSIPITPETPPIDIAYGNAENVSNPPGKPNYRGGINIADYQLHDGRGQTHAYLFYQVGHILAPDMSKLTPTNQRAFEFLLESSDLTDYFNSALWGKPGPSLIHKTGWPARLWEVRKRFGAEFTDRAVAYTLMSLGDNPEEGAGRDSDVYFCRHLRIGEAVVDHESSKWPEIVEILGRQKSGLDRACNAR